MYASLDEPGFTWLNAENLSRFVFFISLFNNGKEEEALFESFESFKEISSYA